MFYVLLISSIFMFNFSTNKLIIYFCLQKKEKRKKKRSEYTKSIFLECLNNVFFCHFYICVLYIIILSYLVFSLISKGDLVSILFSEKQTTIHIFFNEITENIKLKPKVQYINTRSTENTSLDTNQVQRKRNTDPDTIQAHRVIVIQNPINQSTDLDITHHLTVIVTQNQEGKSTDLNITHSLIVIVTQDTRDQSTDITHHLMLEVTQELRERKRNIIRVQINNWNLLRGVGELTITRSQKMTMTLPLQLSQWMTQCTDKRRNI